MDPASHMSRDPDKPPVLDYEAKTRSVRLGTWIDVLAGVMAVVFIFPIAGFIFVATLRVQSMGLLGKLLMVAYAYAATLFGVWLVRSAVAAWRHRHCTHATKAPPLSPWWELAAPALAVVVCTGVVARSPLSSGELWLWAVMLVVSALELWRLLRKRLAAIMTSRQNPRE